MDFLILGKKNPLHYPPSTFWALSQHSAKAFQFQASPSPLSSLASFQTTISAVSGQDFFRYPCQDTRSRVMGKCSHYSHAPLFSFVFLTPLSKNLKTKPPRLFSEVLHYILFRPRTTLLLKKHLHLQGRDWIPVLRVMTQVYFYWDNKGKRGGFLGRHVTSFKVYASDMIFSWSLGNRKLFLTSKGQGTTSPSLEDWGDHLKFKILRGVHPNVPILSLRLSFSYQGFGSSKGGLSSFHSISSVSLPSLQFLSVNFQYDLSSSSRRWSSLNQVIEMFWFSQHVPSC